MKTIVVDTDVSDGIVRFVLNGHRGQLDLPDALRLLGISLTIAAGGYLRTTQPGSHEKLVHRIIMGLERGDAREVDHVNGDRMDNRRANLRYATPSQNNCNWKVRPDNTSGVTGVYWDPNRSRWTAHIAINKKRIPLGRFVAFDEALSARRAAEEKYHGEFAARLGAQAR